MKALKELSKNLAKMNENEIYRFLNEILTPAEISALSKRWRIVELLATTDYTQREIAKTLGVSLCKVTRGAKILKTTNAITKKIIQGEKNDNEFTKNKHTS